MNARQKAKLLKRALKLELKDGGILWLKFDRTRASHAQMSRLTESLSSWLGNRDVLVIAVPEGVDPLIIEDGRVRVSWNLKQESPVQSGVLENLTMTGESK